MQKRFFKFVAISVTLLVSLVAFSGCPNPNESHPNSNESHPYMPDVDHESRWEGSGWYAQVHTTDGRIYGYYCYDSNKECIRGGSSDHEISNASSIPDYNFDSYSAMLQNSVDAYGYGFYLRKITDSSLLPSWAN